jgi:hypothetical protein
MKFFLSPWQSPLLLVLLSKPKSTPRIKHSVNKGKVLNSTMQIHHGLPRFPDNKALNPLPATVGGTAVALM